MEIHIEADIGDGPVQLTAGLWPLVQWERKFNTKSSQLADKIGLEDLPPAVINGRGPRASGPGQPARLDHAWHRLRPHRTVSPEAVVLRAPRDDR